MKGAWRHQAPPTYKRALRRGLQQPQLRAEPNPAAPSRRESPDPQPQHGECGPGGGAAGTAAGRGAPGSLPGAPGTAEPQRLAPSFPTVTLDSPTGPCPGAALPPRRFCPPRRYRSWGAWVPPPPQRRGR